MKRIINFIFIGGCLIASFSCNKEWLEEKPSQRLAVASTLTDCQALLDNNIMQTSLSFGETGADNYYAPDGYLPFFPSYETNSYLWKPDIFAGLSSFPEWTSSYQQVYNTNLSLETLAKISLNSTNENDYHNIKGQSFFYRANAFFNLASLFSKQFDNVSAGSDPGIPLRLTTDFNKVVKRGTLKATYEQVVTDLKQSIPELPINQLSRKYFRPSRLSAYGLLSRVYMTMQDYDNALLYADSALKLNSTLLDYNTLSSMRFITEEVSFYSQLSYAGILTFGMADSLLYKSYANNDLRKGLFFSMAAPGEYIFVGSYSNAYYNFFSGIANDEMFLNRAECFARKGNISSALADLNALLVKRYSTGTFVPYSGLTQAQALAIILEERRKELLFRGIRWTDLRRLNKETAYAKTLTRVSEGKTYTLPPNDNRYVYPIPNDEILFNSIEQNPR